MSHISDNEQGTPSWLYNCLNLIKVFIIATSVVYFWVLMSDRRYEHLGAIEEMCIYHNFPEKTVFHH